MVCEELLNRHQARGKSARVARILRAATAGIPAPCYAGTAQEEIARLRHALDQATERTGEAEGRARVAEERERAHQDYWAQRYLEKLDEFDRQQAALVKVRERAATDQYLRLHQRIAELERQNLLLTKRLAELP